MFDQVTRKEGGPRRAGRQGVFLLGSTGLQAGLGMGLVLVASAIRAKVQDEPMVPIQFVRAAPPAPVPLPPAPPPPEPTAVRHRPEAKKPSPPAALLQPRETPKIDVHPEPDDRPEEESSVANENETVIGGGSVAGSAESVVAKPPPPPVAPIVKDVPVYAGVGFTRPQQAEKNCVQSSLQIPRGLEGFASTVTVRFAIGTDGVPALFQVQPPEPDARLRAAIWQAVQGCRWMAGTNPQGKPTKIWVVMPLRFQAG